MQQPFQAFSAAGPVHSHYFPYTFIIDGRPDHSPKGESLVAFATFLGTVRNEISHLTEVIIVHVHVRSTVVLCPDHT